MATYTSQATTLLVQAPPAFGHGSDRGSYANGVWTPGRDANGVVNTVSWELVPRGQWSRAAGTHLGQVDAAIKAALPGWRDVGTSSGDYNILVEVWNGCALDPDGARLWFTGGGHAASSNNGLYRFDAYKMAWSIECLPSDSTLFTTRYATLGGGNTSYSFDQDSWEAAQAKRAAGTWSPVNDAFHDELSTDRKPTSRHTYQGLVYAPDKNEVVMACRRLWRYSLSSGQWYYRRNLGDDFNANPFGEGNVAFYDSSRGQILASAYGSNGSYSFAYDLAANAWVKRGQLMEYKAPWDLWNCLSSYQNAHIVTVVRNPRPAGELSGGGAEYARYDMRVARDPTNSTTTNAGTVQAGRFALTGGYTRDMFRPDIYLPSLVEVPGNKLWYLTQKTDKTWVWFEIDMTTSPWTMSPKTFAGNIPLPAASDGGGDAEPGRKIMYVPAMDAVLFFYRGAAVVGDFYIYRF